MESDGSSRGSVIDLEWTPHKFRLTHPRCAGAKALRRKATEFAGSGMGRSFGLNSRNNQAIVLGKK